MAEVIFENLCKKNKRKDIVVKSAGLDAVNGYPMSQTAFEALLHCGEKLGRKKFTSTQFNSNMISEFDYIVCMSLTHKAYIKAYIGEYPNVYTLDDLTGCGDIADPFMQTLNVYKRTCQDLQVALAKMYEKLMNSN